jgi:hypothetical protein
MSTQGKPLRVIAAFGNYNVGDIIYPTGIYRDQLKNQRLCTELERDEGDLVECATVGPDECAVTRAAPKRKRGRPRKQVL